MTYSILWRTFTLVFVLVVPTPGQPCDGLVADLDKDSAVTFADFFILADQFGMKSEVGNADSLGGGGNKPEIWW